LRVSLDVATSGVLSFEGGVFDVRVDGDGYGETFGLDPRRPLVLRLRAGSYRVMPWSRSCILNCGHVGPPGGYCHTDVALDRPRETFVFVRGRGCDIARGTTW
jgi:hypothetical protein